MEITIKDALRKENTLFIDLRTKNEYKKSHINNSINFEILNTKERQIVSKLHRENKQNSYETAYEYALKKLPKLFNLIKKNSEKNIIFYCSQGRSRSSITYKVFSDLKGYSIFKLLNGYKSYRKYLNENLGEIIKSKQFITFHGLSGVGKTELLKNLEKEGFQTLNFAEIIQNTGSIFGDFINSEKKSALIEQKEFEDIIFNKLFYGKSPIFFIESEGNHLAHINIRKEIYNGILNGDHYLIEKSMTYRIDQIYNDYIINNPIIDQNLLVNKIDNFKKRFGSYKIKTLKQFILRKEYKPVIRFLLSHYYDPLYEKSINKYKPYKKIFKPKENIIDFFKKNINMI